jgi:hypothetical protein
VEADGRRQKIYSGVRSSIFRRVGLLLGADSYNFYSSLPYKELVRCVLKKFYFSKWFLKDMLEIFLEIHDIVASPY